MLREGDLLIGYAAGSERLFAYALTPRGGTLVDLGDRTSIESDMWAFERSIARYSDADPRQIVALGAQLREQLLAPALADGDVERLIVGASSLLFCLDLAFLDRLIAEALRVAVDLGSAEAGGAVRFGTAPIRLTVEALLHLLFALAALLVLSLALLERLGASVASYGEVLSVVGTGPVAAVTRQRDSRLDTLI